ncbi:phospholipase D family protein [Psychromonas aquimarina]|uniref:phospholipase D family protein n=1 Tax=Psychromonas aquimarina TaxID=444919 RepID=UPI00040E4D6C|nr:phospholipase D family protein [Psychromonas aquimarina]
MLKHIIPLLAVFFLFSCAGLPDNTSSKSYAMSKSQESQLTMALDEERRLLGLNNDDALMMLLEDGVDAFVARVSLINAAQKSVDLQYYQYHSDLSGGLLTAALWQAAERGVRIRLLVDDMDLAGKDIDIAKLTAHPNFEVRIFNPFLRDKRRTRQFITGFGSVTRRMHNKTFTVDSSISILGGRNIGDQYYGAHSDVAFGDLDIAFTGGVVQEVQTSFDLYWNSEITYGINLLNDYQPSKNDLKEVGQTLQSFIEEHRDSQYAQALRENDLISLVKKDIVNEYTGNAEVLYDDPLKVVSSREKTEYHLTPKLRPYVNNAKDELVIVSPYFVPGDEGVALFGDLVKKGVTVRILTNSMKSNDVTIVHSGYSKYRKALLALGVELYEVDSTRIDVLKKYTDKAASSTASKLTLHAKYFVIDRKVTFIGSMNLDPRSRSENTEIGVIAESEKLGAFIVKDFDSIVKDGAFKLSLKEGEIIWTQKDGDEIRTYNNDPYSSWWDRFKNGFLQWLPVESQL